MKNTLIQLDIDTKKMPLGKINQDQINKAKDILKNLAGIRCDVYCTNSIVFRGSIETVENGVIRLSDEDGRVFSINVSKVVAVSETAEGSTRPGFLA